MKTSARLASSSSHRNDRLVLSAFLTSNVRRNSSSSRDIYIQKMLTKMKRKRCYSDSNNTRSSYSAEQENGGMNEIPLLATTTFVGIAVASFWRGAWYVADELMFKDDAAKSGTASFACGVVGLATSQHVKLMMLKDKCSINTTNARRVVLFAPAAYGVGLSCVLFWRGVWVFWDCMMVNDDDNNNNNNNNNNKSSNSIGEEGVESDDDNNNQKLSPKLLSGIISHAAGLGALVMTGFLASAACPPAGLWVARDATTAIRVARLARNL